LKKHLLNDRSGMGLAIAIEGGLAVLAVLLAWTFHLPLKGQLVLSGFQQFGRAVLLGILATLPLLAMFWWLVHATWPAARRLRELVERLIYDLFPRASLLELAVISAVAGVSEELLFRGVLQPLIGRWTTPVVGLIIASIVFGLFHAASLLYFALAALVGAYFGWLVLEFCDLVSPIVAHGLYDFLALAYLTRQIKSRNFTTRGIAAPNALKAENERSND
jgi:CAAX protease family protein